MARVAGRLQSSIQSSAPHCDKLEFLLVIDSFDSPLAQKADMVLPKAASLEKDGTFTSFDRTVQRVRATVPAMGESKPVARGRSARSSERMGYGFPVMPASQIMSEIGRLVPAYGGVTYCAARAVGNRHPGRPASRIPALRFSSVAPMVAATLSLAYTAAV